MTASMTAYSRLQGNYSTGRLVWEIRSVNHRHLDVHLKLPNHLRIAEPGCRERITRSIARGRVDATLEFEPRPDLHQEVEVNEQVAGSLVRALHSVAEICPGSGDVNLIDFLRWPGVMEPVEPDYPALAEAAEELLDEALKELIEVRLREGAHLEVLIGERVESASRITRELQNELPEIRETLKTRWESRLGELGDTVDPVRIAQEQAILLTKADISEELDRLETHLAEIHRVLGHRKPHGRRLEFLTQELHREANTLGAKSRDLRITNASVELKVLIDQMREQIQNIE